ncbi:hypothetical protein ACFW0F_06105 [Brucella anthropi]|uniref:hypothetical protein n=1 Tax=Brucella anthropi TaxID=529 RepID=UPI00366BDFFC
MAETKFTPGPWDFEPSGKEAGYIGFPDGSGFYAAIREGDGHLIAAGPDLYEALQGAIGALEYSVDCARDDGNNSDIDFAQSKLDAALTALAKARGEANG